MKNILVIGSIFCMGIPAVSVCAPLKSGGNRTRPNVVFIYADDLGRGMLSHYGQKYISTPNIDCLFKEGTSFEYAYGCMYSAPARASMLTGYHDCHTNKWNISKGGKLKEANTYEKLDSVEKEVNPLRVRRLAFTGGF